MSSKMKTHARAPRRTQPHTRKLLKKEGIDKAVSIVDERKVEGMSCATVAVKDGYHQRRYKLERLGSQLFAARLEAYLAKRQHIDFAHSKNVVRKVLYALPSFREWSGFMPGALALEPIHHPELKRLATGKRLDPITRRLFRHGLDPVGVRSRTLVAGWLAKQYVSKKSPEQLNWLSLAGGTAAPSLLMLHASEADVSRVRYTNIDIDKKSIDIAKELVAIEGIPKSQTKLVTGDIFDKQLLARHLKKGSADIIDLMGIFEYLDDKQSVQLLKSSYELLKPGGLIIACNMRQEHPQLNLHKRGVGWPGVIPRLVRQMKELTHTAGIPAKNVRIYQPKDGVYNVAGITKV